MGKIDDSNIIFEELCENFLTYGDNIITQVVHVEYYCEDNEYYMKHIDHEYIFYSIDEYERRLKESAQKGYKKIKTFKIDDSKIPLNYDVCTECRSVDGSLKKQKVLLLHLILESYFQHVDLLDEYFSGIYNEVAVKSTNKI